MKETILLLSTLTLFACADSPTAPDDNPTGFDPDHQLCLSETNRYRAMAGSPPVQPSSALDAYAQQAAASDAASGRPHSYSNANATGGWGENEVLRVPLGNMGGSVPNAIRQGIAWFWEEGPSGPHRQILVNPAYTQLGCGWVVDGGGLVTFVQHFRR